MDIKDVNSANPLLFSKAAAINSAAAALGSGFANLLGQTAQVVVNNRDAAVDVSRKAEKSIAKENSEDIRTPHREDKEKNKNIKETAKEKAPKPAKAKRAENADVSVNQNNEVRTVQNAAKPEAEEVNVAAVQVPAEAATAEMTETVAVNEIAETAAAENTMPQITAENEAVDGKNEAQPAVSEENAKAGENTAGFETAAAGGDGAEAEAEVVVAKTTAVAEEEDVVVGGNKKSAKSDKKAAGTDVAAADDGKVIDSLAKEQSVRLSEKIENKQQLKVSVNVAEEKIAYREGQDAFKSRIAIDEAVAAANAEGAEEASADSVTIAANANGRPQMQTTVVGAYTAPIQNLNAPVAETVSAVQSAETAAVSTQGGQTAHVMSGSEFVAAAKTEAAGKENTPSFKEVYKGMSKEAVDQIKVNITKSAVKGVDKIDVHLKPEELGRIEIKMQIGKDGKLQAHIIASRPETAEMLQKEVQSLEKAFNDAGFQTDEGSLSFSFREDGQSGHNQNNGSELRSFIGNVFELEANNELLAANSDIQGWISDKGLNIRV